VNRQNRDSIKKEILGEEKMLKKINLFLALSLLFCIATSEKLYPIEAQRFMVKTSPAENILLSRDHFNVTILKGWISSKDSWFIALLSRPEKLIVSIEEEVTFFDKEKVNKTSLFDNTDIKPTLNRPWGLNILLLNNIPADADARLVIKLTINRNDRLTQLFNALDASNADMPAEIFAAPWYGYAKAVNSILRVFLGTDAKSFPFIWTGDIKLSDVVVGDALSSHYIVLISPNSDKDQFFSKIDASKISYDVSQQQPTYDGQIIYDHSYLILKVSKAEPYNVGKHLLDSTEPWAVLGCQFMNIPLKGVKTSDQLSTIEDNYYAILNNMIDLLKRERRFSMYDRATALMYFAGRVKDELSKKCNELKLDPCPTTSIQQFIDYIARTFNLPITITTDDLMNRARELNKYYEERIRQQTSRPM
jgi:hypothetical protein